MINLIIKRDGTVEPFEADKINGWGEWAAESLGGMVDWTSVVMETVKELPETCSSRDLQNALIKNCLNKNSWSNNRMAGRLYAAVLHKDLYGKGELPTIRQVHSNLQEAGFMTTLTYSEEEYAKIEKFIKHKRDFGYAHFQLYHIRYKYALRNRVNATEMESPQFVFMRMAMALAENRPVTTRLTDVKAFYDLFSLNVINAPTPNYVNLGTKHNGFASCCLITNYDTAESIGVADHIAYTMTYMSAGIGHSLQTRSIKDPVRGGLIAHQGKFFYLDRLKGSIKANLQNGRGGACTVYYNAFDPEADMLARLKNPMTPAAKQIRGMDYNMVGNKFFGRMAARGEQMFTFNCFTAPDLYDAFYSDDDALFARLYAKYEADPNFKKNYVSAREVALVGLNEGYETGRAYLAFADEINRHTPYKDPIYSSNLCAEIVEPTRGYEYMIDLYQTQDVGYNKFITTEGAEFTLTASHPILLDNGKYGSGLDAKAGVRFMDSEGAWHTVQETLEFKHEPEVALCSLAGLVVSNIKNDEEYERAMYYALLMIDICIHKSTYALPHIGHTAKARMAAAVGMMDLAHYLARKKLKYSTKAGKEEIHRVAERHMYFAIKCSLRLGKELGNAPWIHRTKYADGWLPIDTYQKAVDKIVQVPLQYDWEALRGEVKANGGIRNSSLVAYMPGESSSKASGTVNSIYPARELTIMKTDGNLTTYWAAPNSDKLGRFYELAWDIPTRDMIEVYGIFQKFTDQAISADLFRKIEGSEKITTDEMLEDYFHMMRVGMKTRYYMNTHTAKAVQLEGDQKAVDGVEERAREIAYYRWLRDTGVTHGSEEAKLYRASLGIYVESDYLLHLYPEALQEATQALEEDASGCGSGGCTL
ncbi:ribonucleotide reductase of class Ia (aerobic), alpha subunit [Xanthomonas phage vB_XciM_LucasX]|nr:ribonucleotide reductase of class Ia (aerobic), alpha subunit [Xanthomonas phage vB_XciM_LucasX]